MTIEVDIEQHEDESCCINSIDVYMDGVTPPVKIFDSMLTADIVTQQIENLKMRGIYCNEIK